MHKKKLPGKTNYNNSDSDNENNSDNNKSSNNDEDSGDNADNAYIIENIDDVEDYLFETILKENDNTSSIIYWEIAFIVSFNFSSFMSFNAFQPWIERIYDKYSNNVHHNSHYFIGLVFTSLAVFDTLFSLIGNLILVRFNENIKIIISTVLMTIALIMMTIFCFHSFTITIFGIYYLLFVYILVGIAIGIFKSNIFYLSGILSKKTRVLAVVSLSASIVIINIVCYILLNQGLNIKWIFLALVIIQVFTIISYCFRVYHKMIWFMQLIDNIKINTIRGNWCIKCKKYILWLSGIWGYSFVNLINGFCMTGLSIRTIYYLYSTTNNKNIIVFNWIDPNISMHVETFIVIHSIIWATTILLSKLLFYHLQSISFLIPLILFLSCILLFLTGIPELILMSCVFMGFATGSLYMQTVKEIEAKNQVEKELFLFSFWIFMGGLGIVIGINLAVWISQLTVIINWMIFK